MNWCISLQRSSTFFVYFGILLCTYLSLTMKLQSALLPFVLAPGAIYAQGKAPRPNVILIYADDLGYGDLSCYGTGRVETPNIDRLGAQGIRFTNAYAPAATSTPSRYAMLTGEYAWRRRGTDVAAGNAGMIIRPERYTMADLFRNEGYATGVIGKWHLGLGDKTAEQDWNAPLSCDPRDIGFEYSYIMAATADRVPCVFIEQGRVVNHDPTAPIEVRYDKPFEGEPLGATHPELLTKLRHSHGHDMAIVNGIGRIGFMKGGGKALWKDEEIADSIVHRTKHFIDEYGDKPFFLYLAPNDIHVPRYPHSRFRGKSGLGLRGDALLQLDWTVGEVVSYLKEKNLLDNTLIIVSSDNGGIIDDGYDDKAEELLRGHDASGGLRGHKYSAFDGGARIPAIVHWPARVAAGQVSREVVSQMDWFASFAQLLGARIPKRGDIAPDSQDDNAAWFAGKKTARPYIIAQAANKTLSLRRGKWKYIEPSKGPKMIQWGPKVETGNLPEPQLYDMDADPRETKNLARKHPKIVKELAEALAQERQKTKTEMR